MKFRNLFTRHPGSVGESYLEHMWQAGSFGVRMLALAIVSFVHALLPFVFEETASQAIADLHGRLSRRHAEAAGRGLDSIE